MTKFEWEMSENGVDFESFFSDYSIPNYVCEDYFTQKYRLDSLDFIEKDLEKEIWAKCLLTKNTTKCVVKFWVSVIATAEITPEVESWESL